MYTIVLTINATEYDISNEVIEDSLKLDFSLYNDDLKATTNKVSFELGRVSSVIPILLASTGNISISIKLSTIDIFTGYLTDNYKASIQYARFDNVKISGEDYSIKKLKTAWISTDTIKTLWLDTAICNPAAPSASLIHLICALAGVTVSTSYAIDSTASITVIDEDKNTYFDVLEKLLFEMGYIPHFNGSGQLELYQLYKTTPTAAHTLTTSTYLVGEIDIEKELQQYDESRIKWREIETLSDVIISNDTTGAAGIYDCVIPVSPETYYPSNTDSEAPTYIEYSLESGKEIVYVSAATTDIVTDDGVTSTFTNLGTKGKLSIYNSNPSVIKNIYRLKIIATTLKAIKADRITLSNLTAGASQKYIEYDAEYIHLATDANRLSNILAYYYTYADYTYSFKSYTEYDLGEIVTLQDTGTGLDVLVAITDKTIQIGKPFQYKSVGVGDFTIDETTIDSGTYEITVSPIPQITETLETMPTYEEILSGFTDITSGGTTTPEPPIVNGGSLFRTSYLVWDKQATLTGDIRHDIYRSTNNIDFTLLATVGSETQFQDATMSLGGTADAPEGITYYYKLKRKSGETLSGFSNTVNFTSAPIPTADLAANSITAAKIATAVLNALIANINSYLQISNSLGFLASDAGTTTGETRAYLDKDEINLEEYISGVWENLISITATGTAGSQTSSILFGNAKTAKIEYDATNDGINITELSVAGSRVPKTTISADAPTGGTSGDIHYRV